MNSTDSSEPSTLNDTRSAKPTLSTTISAEHVTFTIVEGGAVITLMYPRISGFVLSATTSSEHITF